MRWAPLVGVLAACGRVGFDAIGSDAAGDAMRDGSAACQLDDDFEAGLGAWSGPWTTHAGVGPDGSTAAGFAGPTAGTGAYLTHPALHGVDAVHVALDIRIDATTGDLNVLLLAPGWTDATSDGYDIGMFPLTGDNAEDAIVRNLGGAAVPLAQHALTIAQATWHHLDVVRAPSGAISVHLDDAVYMASPANAEVAPPFDVVIRMFNASYVDNVHVTCP